MNHALKLVVGLATVTGLMGSEIGVANATSNTTTLGASPAAFVGLSPSDTPSIDHGGAGRYVTNNDTAGPHNAVASLGIVASGAFPVFNIRAQNFSTDTLTCWIFADDVFGGEQIAFQQWAPNTGSTVKPFAIPNSFNHLATVTAFCAIPKTASTGNAEIFSVWAQ